MATPERDRERLERYRQEAKIGVEMRDGEQNLYVKIWTIFVTDNGHGSL